MLPGSILAPDSSAVASCSISSRIGSTPLSSMDSTPSSDIPARRASFRLGTDDDGNAYIAVAGQEERYLMDSREALLALVRGIKAGKADHLV